MKIYKNNNNCLWYVDENGDGALFSYPFGHFVLNFLNTANSMENKERFVRNEIEWLNPNDPSAKHQNLTNINGNVTKESLEEYYIQNKQYINKNIWWNEYKTLIEYIKNLDSFRNGKYGNSTRSLYSIYANFKYFATMVGNTELYEPQTTQRLKKWENKQKDYIQFTGYCFLDNHEPCEVYELQDLNDIFIMDFWEFLFNPKVFKTKVCKECNLLFASNNTNATYCNFCKKNMGQIRYKNRKSNQERYLHKQIVDYLYLLDETKDLSNKFLNESNYYWDIVQGKKIAENKIYRTDITTKESYMKWLREQESLYKKGRNLDGTKKS